MKTFTIEEKTTNGWKPATWAEEEKEGNVFNSSEYAEFRLTNYLFEADDAFFAGNLPNAISATDFRVVDEKGNVVWAPKNVRYPVESDLKELTPCTVFGDGETWDGIDGNIVFLREDEIDEAMSAELSGVEEIPDHDHVEISIQRLLEDHFKLKALQKGGISVVVEGGVVHSVVSDVPNLDMKVNVIDYDVQKDDSSELSEVAFEDGNTESASVFTFPVLKSEIRTIRKLGDA